MRNFINKYGYAIAAVAVVIAVVAIFLNTRKKPTPPLPGKDGRDSLVIAIKFKGDTDKEAKTMYLVKFPTNIRDIAKAMPKDSLKRMNLLESNRLVRSPEPGSQWVLSSDDDGQKIAAVPESSPGHPRRAVFPANP